MFIRSTHHCRSFSVAVLLEANARGQLATINKHVVTAAKQISQDVHGIVLTSKISKSARKLGLAAVTQIESNADLRLAEHACSALSALDQKLKPDIWIAGHSAFGKNVMPRLSGLLGIPCISDVMRMEKAGIFVRPIYAGNALATIKCLHDRKVLTVRATAFEPENASNDECMINTFEYNDDSPSSASQYIGMDSGAVKGTRPELSSARVIISGGRALGSKENFEKLLGALADLIPGSAIGASRAAVDAGQAPNDLQVGQTGKIVAPSLYIAVGISGAIQHVAGMKDSGVIVAINKDSDAPIFQIADYGLAGDLFKIIPELTEKLGQLR